MSPLLKFAADEVESLPENIENVTRISFDERNVS